MFGRVPFCFIVYVLGASVQLLQTTASRYHGIFFVYISNMVSWQFLLFCCPIDFFLYFFIVFITSQSYIETLDCAFLCIIRNVSQCEAAVASVLFSSSKIAPEYYKLTFQINYLFFQQCSHLPLCSLFIYRQRKFYNTTEWFTCPFRLFGQYDTWCTRLVNAG